MTGPEVFRMAIGERISELPPESWRLCTVLAGQQCLLLQVATGVP